MEGSYKDAETKNETKPNLNLQKRKLKIRETMFISI